MVMNISVFCSTGKGHTIRREIDRVHCTEMASDLSELLVENY